MSKGARKVRPGGSKFPAEVIEPAQDGFFTDSRGAARFFGGPVHQHRDHVVRRDGRSAFFEIVLPERQHLAGSLDRVGTGSHHIDAHVFEIGKSIDRPHPSEVFFSKGHVLVAKATAILLHIREKNDHRAALVGRKKLGGHPGGPKNVGLGGTTGFGQGLLQHGQELLADLPIFFPDRLHFGFVFQFVIRKTVKGGGDGERSLGQKIRNQGAVVVDRQHPKAVAAPETGNDPGEEGPAVDLELPPGTPRFVDKDKNVVSLGDFSSKGPGKICSPPSEGRQEAPKWGQIFLGPS